jgi:hypothetical protein
LASQHNPTYRKFKDDIRYHVGFIHGLKK